MKADDGVDCLDANKPNAEIPPNAVKTLANIIELFLLAIKKSSTGVFCKPAGNLSCKRVATNTEIPSNKQTAAKLPDRYLYVAPPDTKPMTERIPNATEIPPTDRDIFLCAVKRSTTLLLFNPAGNLSCWRVATNTQIPRANKTIVKKTVIILCIFLL